MGFGSAVRKGGSSGVSLVAVFAFLWYLFGVVNGGSLYRMLCLEK